MYPSFSKENTEKWLILIGRGIIVSLSYATYTIALIYCYSGDVVLLRSVTTSMGTIAFGVCLFGEKPGWMVGVSFVLCIISVIFICQPSFIFTNSDVTPISGIGFLFIAMSCVFRLLGKVFTKYSKHKLDIHWLATTITSVAIVSVISTSVFFFSWIYYGEDINKVWYPWYKIHISGIRTADVKIVTFFVATFGFFETVLKMCNIKGFGIGNFGRVGIITNVSIGVSYILQVTWLKQNVNGIGIGGIVLAVFALGLVFYDDYRNKNSASGSTGNNNTNNNQASNNHYREYQAINNSDPNTDDIGNAQEFDYKPIV